MLRSRNSEVEKIYPSTKHGTRKRENVSGPVLLDLASFKFPIDREKWLVMPNTVLNCNVAKNLARPQFCGCT